MSEKQMILELAKTLHDVINEICAEDNRTIENLMHIQKLLREWIKKHE